MPDPMPQPVLALVEGLEQQRGLRMSNGLAGLVWQQVLFRHIGHVGTLVVFGEQMVERLVLRGAAVFVNVVVPFVALIL